jgi:hypothetical protein
MSTNINITVGGNVLLDVAKQQQAANRQAQLNREASNRLEAQATAARTTALAAQGRDANGNLITGAPLTQPKIDRRPAANRSDGPPNFLLVPHQDFVSNSVPKNTLAAKTKGIKNKSFFEFLFSDPNFGRIGASAVFVPSGGPGGAPFLQTPSGTPEVGFYNAFVQFPVCDNANVLDVVDDYTAPFRVLTSSGVVEPKQINKPVHKLKEYTVEAYFKGDTSYPPIGTVAGRAEIGMNYNDYAGGGATVIRALLEYNSFHDFGPSSYLYSLYVLGFDGFEVQIFFNSYWLADPDGPNASMPSYGYIWPELLQPNAWYHLALVKTETSQSLYFQGTLIVSVATDFSRLADLPDEAVYSAYADFESGGVEILRPSLSGFRFTPRVLYTGPFTPPASITSLA